MLKMLVAVAIVAQAAAPTTPSAQSIKVTPSVVGEIDLGKIKGTLVRQLAWSPDGSQFYLMTYDPNPDASIKATYHYLIPAAGGAPKRVDVQPDWADGLLEVEVGQGRAGRSVVCDRTVAGQEARGGRRDPDGGRDGQGRR